MPDRTVVREQVLGALEECQRSFAVHRKCILRLKQAQAADPEEFRETFVDCLNRALLVFKREPAVERFVSLVTSFVAFQNEKYACDGELAASLLEYLIPLTAAKDKAVRFRACQLTAKLLNGLGEDSEVSEDLFEEMADAMLVRLKDKVPVVRVHAAAALSRLQDPTDAEDPVTSEYLRLVGSDSSKEVRKAILANIGPSKITIPHMLGRIRDVREDVRKYAYNVVAIKIEVGMLSIAQRVLLLGNGLKDRSPIVRKACQDLLCKKWLASPRCEGDPVRLLKLLDVELHPTEAETALRVIFDHLGVKKLAQFLPKDLAALSPEQAFYWRVCGKYATEKDNDDLMDAALPEIPRLCDALNGVVHAPFCAAEVLKLVPLLDLGDEVGRRRLYTMLGAMLLSLQVSDALVPGLLAGIHAMEGTPEEYLAFASGIISTLASPEQDDRGDPDAIVRRSLAIARELLRTFSDLTTLARCADQLKALVEGCMQHPSPEVRNEAVECLGLFCCLDEVVAGSYVPLLLKVFAVDGEALQATALKAMLDILLLFNSAAPCQLPASLIPPADAPPPADGALEECVLFRRAVAALEHPSAAVRAVAAEGLAKLLINTRLQASAGSLEEEVLLALLLTYFSPESEKDSRTRQCLATLFPALARRSAPHVALLARVLVPAVSHVARARKASPLARVSAVQVGQYLLALLDEACDPPEDQKVSFAAPAAAALRRVARALARAIGRTGGASATGRACARLLALVRVQGGRAAELRALARAVGDAAEEVDDAVGRKAVGKCAAVVADALAVAEGRAPAGGAARSPASPEEDEDEDAPADAPAEAAPAAPSPAEEEEEEEFVVEEEELRLDVMPLFGGADDEDDEGEGQARRAPRARKAGGDAEAVRRSGRERKTIVAVKAKEAEMDRLLARQEAKEKAEWSEDAEEEDEDEEEPEEEEEAAAEEAEAAEEGEEEDSKAEGEEAPAKRSRARASRAAPAIKAEEDKPAARASRAKPAPEPAPAPARATRAGRRRNESE